MTRGLGVPLVVNDRPDLAALVGADYVHVGQDDLPVEAARRFGVARRPVDACAGEIDRADGRLHRRRPCLRDADEGGAARGRARARPLRRRARAQPWFAIGGIDETNVGDVVAAGAERIAVVRAIGDAADPERAAATLRAALPSR